MGSVSAYLEVESPAQHCYDWWRPLTHLPQILPDVRQVEATSPDVTHWKVAGPAGADIEWDAEIVDDEPGRKVAWRSIVPDGGSSNSVPMAAPCASTITAGGPGSRSACTTTRPADPSARP